MLSETECLPEFKVYRKDKLSTSGGLCMWIRSDIPQQRKPHLEFDSNVQHIESIIVELKVKKEKWYIILAYKNPDVPNHIFISKLKNVYDAILSQSNEIILIGDLNINTQKKPNDLDNDFIDIYGLDDIIDSPTCFKKQEGTLIDHIIVKNRKRFSKSINVFCGYSDWHNMVGCVTKLHVPPQKPVKITYRSYKNFDPDLFKGEVSHIPFQVCNVFDDVSDQYWAQRLLITDVLNEHAPLKQRFLKEDHLPYMHSELRKAMYKRNMIKNKHRKDRSNPALRSQYTSQRNKVVQMRKVAIKSYFMSKCTGKVTGKDFWDAIKPFLSKKSKSHNRIMLKENDQVITDNAEICEIFATFFSNIANSIGPTCPIDMTNDNFLDEIIATYSNHESIVAIQNSHTFNIEFRFHKVSSDYVFKILSGLNANKATGFDEIPPKIAKLIAKEMAIPLTNMINTAIEQSVYPEDMKLADLCPLFKKNDDMIKDNYRPVSILPIYSKVFEIVIADQLIEYFKDIFNVLLCAYRKKYGCQHVLVKVLDKWKKALDNNEFAGALLIDLSKAFDCMQHALLVAKMKAYGLSSDACKFISSYLCNRFQRVRISDERSSWKPLTKGVPQGSCLGPLLFNIFMNDIFYFIEKTLLVNYADDNFLSESSSSITVLMDCLKLDGENALHWFRINFMEANPSKLQFMLMKSLSSKTPLPDHIEIENTTIERSTDVKLLGITVDDKLKFDLHINSLCRKAARQINVLTRFKGIFDTNEKEKIHNTFVLANFNYCPIVWHFCSKTSTKKIEKVQERALRFLHNDKTSSYEELLQKSSMTTLHIRRIKAIACEVFKSLNDLNPIFMKDMFQEKEMKYDLRDNNKLIQPKFNKITYGKNTFQYYGSHIWNQLPNTVKESTNLNSFKELLKNWDGPKCKCAMCDVLA